MGLGFGGFEDLNRILAILQRIIMFCLIWNRFCVMRVIPNRLVVILVIW